MSNYHKYNRLTVHRPSVVPTFVPTKKTATVKFRTTPELKQYLANHGKMSAYIESLIYADLQRNGIDIYARMKPVIYLTDEELQ